MELAVIQRRDSRYAKLYGLGNDVSGAKLRVGVSRFVRFAPYVYPQQLVDLSISSFQSPLLLSVSLQLRLNVPNFILSGLLPLLGGYMNNNHLTSHPMILCSLG